MDPLKVAPMDLTYSQIILAVSYCIQRYFLWILSNLKNKNLRDRVPLRLILREQIKMKKPTYILQKEFIHMSENKIYQIVINLIFETLKPMKNWSFQFHFS